MAKWFESIWTNIFTKMVSAYKFHNIFNHKIFDSNEVFLITWSIFDWFRCWIHESKFSWVLVVPVCLSLAASFIFLCNIVRVLIGKLRAGPHVGSGPSPSALQAVRATLLLLPLLGLHYLITPFRPDSASHPLLSTYEVLSAVFTSFQVREHEYELLPAFCFKLARATSKNIYEFYTPAFCIVGTKVFRFPLCSAEQAETVFYEASKDKRQNSLVDGNTFALWKLFL